MLWIFLKRFDLKIESVINRFGPRQVRQESALIHEVNVATGAAPYDSLKVKQYVWVILHHRLHRIVKFSGGPLETVEYTIFLSILSFLYLNKKRNSLDIKVFIYNLLSGFKHDIVWLSFRIMFKFFIYEKNTFYSKY